MPYYTIEKKQTSLTIGDKKDKNGQPLGNFNYTYEIGNVTKLLFQTSKIVNSMIKNKPRSDKDVNGHLNIVSEKLFEYQHHEYDNGTGSSTTQGTPYVKVKDQTGKFFYIQPEFLVRVEECTSSMLYGRSCRPYQKTSDKQQTATLGGKSKKLRKSRKTRRKSNKKRSTKRSRK